MYNGNLEWALIDYFRAWQPYSGPPHGDVEDRFGLSRHEAITILLRSISTSPSAGAGSASAEVSAAVVSLRPYLRSLLGCDGQIPFGRDATQQVGRAAEKSS